MTGPLPTSSNAAPIAGPFREEMILQQLKTVRDPEIPVDIVNLGLVYSATAAQLEGGGQSHRRAHVAHRARLQHVRRHQG